MNLFAGDLAKDSSDRTEGNDKCPTTSISSGCQVGANCPDYFPTGKNYIVEWEWKMNKYQDGFHFCMFILKGINLAICYKNNSWRIMKPNNTNFPATSDLSPQVLLSNSPSFLSSELNRWITWRIEFSTSTGSDKFIVYKDRVKVASAPISSLGTARYFELGTTSIMPECLTSNHQ